MFIEHKKNPGGTKETEGTLCRHLCPIERTEPAYLSTTIKPTIDETPETTTDSYHVPFVCHVYHSA